MEVCEPSWEMNIKTISNSPYPSQYIVAGCKPWNRRVFNEVICGFPGEWVFVSDPEQLILALKQCNPRYIFFLHWSWLLPEEIVKIYECICFHMTDLPYGRGGSPLQNLIRRGHGRTKLTALRMVREPDAGPVYAQEDLRLEGNAEEIYIRASYLSAHIIRRIIEACPQPVPQVGKPTIFKRRKPSESRIPEMDSLRGIYDFIRMLDAEGYPHAFLEHGGFRYEFRRAGYYDNRILADVTITPIKRNRE
jgi:methionyl-tRNA formyltransferase